MPSYNCEAMVEPVTWLGAEPVFFRIDEDLSVDLIDISRRCDPKIRAVIAVHYFGFPQDFSALGEYCANAGITLTENCAHCFFGILRAAPLALLVIM